jgi:hypothetical protein
MLKTFMPIAAAALALMLAHSYSPRPAEAFSLRLDATASGTDADTAFVRHRRWSWRREQRQSGVAVFIVPGLYWGPAWWDPAYSRLCWKKIRPCRGCAENWIFVCWS